MDNGSYMLDPQTLRSHVYRGGKSRRLQTIAVGNRHFFVQLHDRLGFGSTLATVGVSRLKLGLTVARGHSRE